MPQKTPDADFDVIDDVEFQKPCGVPGEDCENVATFAIWCDHHTLGCDYSGFRCEIHRNMLTLAIRRMVDYLARGGSAICGRCGEVIVGNRIEDHYRWIPL